MRGYKAFRKGFKAYGDFQYEIGKTYEITGELKMCANGFHFCENLVDVFGYYYFDESKTVIGEVEAEGEIMQDGTKFCAEKITVLREIPWSEIEEIVDEDNNTCSGNIGSFNSGGFNTNDYNSGDCNTNSHNSGNYNTGKYNTGNHNAGDHNKGDWNAGGYNEGQYNAGDQNSGNYNSGSKNEGCFNSGWYNKGNCNVGNFNNGNYNTGSYNKGNNNSGHFNSNEPTVRIFNKDSGMTFSEFYKLKINWENLEESKEIIEHLPNYDAQIFFETTGIDWRREHESSENGTV